MDKKSKGQLKKLDQKLTLLLRDLQHYSDAKLNESPQKGAWSVLQIMQHLMQAELGAVKYIEKKLSFEPALEKAGMMSNMRALALNTFMSVPIKIKAPDGVSGDNLLTDLTFWDVAKQWKQQRNELEIFINNLPSELFEVDLYKHPLTGKMSIGNMLTFFNKHVDRHTSQIRRTLKRIDAVKQL